MLDKCVTDVSFLAGMLIDKFSYHLPLYRRCQRLQEAGAQLSRSALTNWGSRAIALLQLIVEAQNKTILQSKVLPIIQTTFYSNGPGGLYRQFRGKVPGILQITGQTVHHFRVLPGKVVSGQ